MHLDRNYIPLCLNGKYLGLSIMREDTIVARAYRVDDITYAVWSRMVVC